MSRGGYRGRDEGPHSDIRPWVGGSAMRTPCWGLALSPRCPDHHGHEQSNDLQGDGCSIGCDVWLYLAPPVFQQLQDWLLPSSSAGERPAQLETLSTPPAGRRGLWLRGNYRNRNKRSAVRKFDLDYSDTNLPVAWGVVTGSTEFHRPIQLARRRCVVPSPLNPQLRI